MSRRRKPDVQVLEPKDGKKPVVTHYSSGYTGSRRQFREKVVNVTSGSSSSTPAALPLTPQPSLLQDFEDSDIFSALEPDSGLPILNEELDDPNELPDEPEHIWLEASGLGQNEMLREWLQNWAPVYLDDLFNLHAPPDPTKDCRCSTKSAALYSCQDCLSPAHLCRDCVIASHTVTPTHRIQKWVGGMWQITSLKALGAILVLGEHKTPCENTVAHDFLLGDMNGFHEISVSFCGCHGALDRARQLFKHRIMPCSEAHPSSGFTFFALRHFHFSSTEAKQSGSRFYAVMRRHTNNSQPHHVSDRYREFLRVAREWMFLQDQKRSGATGQTMNLTSDIALRCPACPRLGVNYMEADVSDNQRFLYSQQISYDGSFQLVRKNKSLDEFDICMSDGAKYFVHQASYQAHLAVNKKELYAQSTRGSDCNNHRAANDTWVRAQGLAETGLGACSCGRHTFILPGGVVNYFKGERFAYTDFAIGSVVKRLMDEGSSSIGVFYDIYCHWSKNWRSRSKEVLLPQGELKLPMEFYGGIPKYHLAGHTDGCYAQYSLNNMTGVGRLDAEGCERAWADLNQASGSTSEKGHGSRIDALNHCMQDWNWRKTVGMVNSLLRKWKEANRMAEEQKEMWMAFHHSIDPELTSSWESMSTKAKLVGGKWTSVFLMQGSIETSVTKTLLELNKLEEHGVSGRENSQPGFTAPAWIAEGIEIEYQQHGVILESKAIGKSPTPKQALDLFNRRSALSTRIIRHRNDASTFIDLEILLMDQFESLAEETDGQPELAPLCIPSHLGSRLQRTERSIKVLGIEQTLRRASCFQALQRVRTTSIQKAQMLGTKSQHARGEINNTRIQAMVSRLSARVDVAVWEYQSSYDALISLGVENAGLSPLQPLAHSDLSGLTSILSAKRDLGEGHKRLPWFWSFKDGQGTDAEREEEYNAATRVEWFRGRERYMRWEEETMWTRREMASVVFDFEHRRRSWQKLASSQHARFNPGYQAYCKRQCNLWGTMRDDAFTRCRPTLEIVTPPITLCARAIASFGPNALSAT